MEAFLVVLALLLAVYFLLAPAIAIAVSSGASSRLRALEARLAYDEAGIARALAELAALRSAGAAAIAGPARRDREQAQSYRVAAAAEVEAERAPTRAAAAPPPAPPR